ncbi:hypothetical protein GUJ93_ZPchr0013g37705 [Zizania palustris]|uniref:Uncharacterized protein n=1 Tax=Zizania palustris TaxID=103762 RepID=A0A8J5WTD7_ZIZPA|nr:hypothetical protein GUJ93_ZPchr0013g37705 [Zizania palustris]
MVVTDQQIRHLPATTSRTRISEARPSKEKNDATFKKHRRCATWGEEGDWESEMNQECRVRRDKYLCCRTAMRGRWWRWPGRVSSQPTCVLAAAYSPTIDSLRFYF